jgi:SMC interacting uncharacterized protein involved in chromosome segregation
VKDEVLERLNEFLGIEGDELNEEKMDIVIETLKENAIKLTLNFEHQGEEIQELKRQTSKISETCDKLTSICVKHETEITHIKDDLNKKWDFKNKVIMAIISIIMAIIGLLVGHFRS